MSIQEFDVDMVTADPDLVEVEIEHALNFKGYCVIGMGVNDETQYDALDDIKALRVEDKFQPPPKEIIEGLLGQEGSGEITELQLPEVHDYRGGEKLRTLDKNMSFMCENSVRFLESLGYATTTRTPTVVLRGGEPDFDGPELTEELCSKWIATFNQSKLMLLYFLGPNEATLELTPFHNEEANAVQIVTKPDTLVILRADMLGHSHLSTAIDYTLCCWITTPETYTGPRGWHSSNERLAQVMPVAKELDDWAAERMRTIYGMELQGTLEPGSIPRDWMRVVHHQYFRRTSTPVAVRGEAGHVPGCSDNEISWQTINAGMDYMTDIPLERWDHADYFDPDPDSWMQSTSFRGWDGTTRTAVRHHSFIDGITLFDNKFFGLSTMEAKGMDPMQRHILETSYECLFHAGMKKKDLQLAYIAVYTGCTNPEWNYIEKEASCCGGTSASQAITSNRTSFILGMMGPSASVDVEFASAGVALQLGCTAVSPNHEHRTAAGNDADASCSGGVFLSMTPFMWPRAGALMNPGGRCFTFDQSGQGYALGEMCGSMCLKPYAEKVEGQMAVIDDAPCHGTVVGWRIVNNGRAASLTAPCGPAEQECAHDAVRHAGIDLLDVDGMECHGIGGLLADAVEVSSVATALRGGEGGDREPLVLSAVKSNVGAMKEACAIMQFAKVLHNIRYGVIPPTQHLKTVNPHMELHDTAVHMNTEHVAYRDRSAFHGIACRGMGGTNANLIQWFSADENRVNTARLELQKTDLNFWPGGGGFLDNASRPHEGYGIIGSWNPTGSPEDMRKIEEGVYSFTVTLGMNNWETFQIKMDGEDDKVLHPGMRGGPAGSAVCGPSEASEAEGLNWCIDAREHTYPAQAPEALTDDGMDAAPRADVCVYQNRDKGKPGDQYEVQLVTAGKYRAVTWKKEQPAQGAETDPALLAGSYYIVGSFNDWWPQEMTLIEEGVYTCQVGPLRRPMGQFQIIRNKDWDQVFFPDKPQDDSGSEVLGPDSADQSLSWGLKGKIGDCFQVHFQRSLQDGTDTRSVRWFVDKKPPGRLY